MHDRQIDLVGGSFKIKTGLGCLMGTELKRLPTEKETIILTILSFRDDI